MADLFRCDADALRETKPGNKDEGALLVLVENEEVWIPKSQIHADSEVYAEGHSGELVIPTWLADKKGLR